MKVAIILGAAQGNKLKERLQAVKDNLNIDSFEDVPSFLDSALKRNAIYDRIVVLSTKLNVSIAHDLYNYWASTSKETSLVMIGKADVDTDKANGFLKTFQTPVAAVMLVSSTTVQLIAEAILVSASELNNKYGVKDFLSVEIDDDSYVPEPPTPVQVQTPTQMTEQPRTAEPRERRTLLGSLFGCRKKKGHDPQSEQQMQQSEPQLQVQEPVEEPPRTPVNYNQGAQVRRPSQVRNQARVQTPITSPQTESVSVISEHQSEDMCEPSDNEVFGGEVPVSEATNGFGGDTASNSGTGYEAEPDTGNGAEEFQSPFDENFETFGANFSPDVETVDDDDFSQGFEDVPTYENDFEPEQIEGMETFEGVGSATPRVPVSSDVVDEADASDSALVLGSAEDAYRQDAEQPRVITKTVVKEVPVPGKGGSGILNSVKSGRLHKTLIVTGDRGSGITSAAFSIAQYLSKYVEVLYFDCDTDNHGLLNYIDYNRFMNYENTHLNGVKLCRSSKAFDNCVVPWGDNLYILTSDFTCDVEDEDLQKTQEIVAERAPDFGVVVVDCPLHKLHLMLDLSLTAQAIFCVEGSRRGFMNALCGLESSKMPVRHKRTLASRGTIFVTKCGKNLDLNKLLQFFQSFFEPDSVDWLSMPSRKFDGHLDDRLLSEVLEG